MCNCYDLVRGNAPWQEELERQIAVSVPHLDKVLNIRKTDSGMIVRLARGKREAATMRWGFPRKFNPAVNNARDDKLESRMWAESWRTRRCVIPVAAYYEWSGPKGQKQTHAFTGKPGHWLWAAGIWEENAEQGMCYSMITVDANKLTRPIHKRMPALLAFDAIDEYLESNDPRKILGPYESQMQTFPCQNPLKMKEPGPPVPMDVEQDLF